MTIRCSSSPPPRNSTRRLLVGFATQTSIEPSRFLVCLSKHNHTYRVTREAGVLVVHLVPDNEWTLAELFGGQTR